MFPFRQVSGCREGVEYQDVYSGLVGIAARVTNKGIVLVYRNGIQRCIPLIIFRKTHKLLI